MIKSLLRLFNSVYDPEEAKAQVSDGRVDEKVKVKRNIKILLEEQLKNGFIFGETVTPTQDLINQVSEVIGLSGDKANAAFHKSWKKIVDSTQEELAYAYEDLGMTSLVEKLSTTKTKDEPKKATKKKKSGKESSDSKE